MGPGGILRDGSRSMSPLSCTRPPDSASPQEHRRALDFGCGVGRLTQALADYVDHAVGVDIAPSMIELARRHNTHGSRCEYIVNDTDHLSRFADQIFDVVYTGRVLQHIAPQVHPSTTFASSCACWHQAGIIKNILRSNASSLRTAPHSRSLPVATGVRSTSWTRRPVSRAANDDRCSSTSNMSERVRGLTCNSILAIIGLSAVALSCATTAGCQSSNRGCRANGGGWR